MATEHDCIINSSQLFCLELSLDVYRHTHKKERVILTLKQELSSSDSSAIGIRELCVKLIIRGAKMVPQRGLFCGQEN